MLRLITIPISHYCEKARWALDHAGLGYSEEAHLQVVHYRAVKRAGGSGTVPVLVHPEGVLTDSTDILHWVDTRVPAERRLFPDDPPRSTVIWHGVGDGASSPRHVALAAWASS